MLKLDNIVKVYETGGENVTALRGIGLCFRESEFVAVLGHSGCGKTTLLNIIGGLDQYTQGDLIINGRSTKEFRDSDWDAYRNHSVGFVFQSYNLIPHQSVLSNVELALTLSGVGKAERRRRAAEALEKVGLGDKLKKRPNQLSGGQMQRVAIARALVNDPDILLADEPTGALDSETSVQVMDLLAEIAKEKLVIMVTHNPELAQKYASRIIQLKDGQVTGDSMPYSGGDTPPAPAAKQKKPSMSFPTALNLSLNNLMTKKGRTILTSFAGSIGIIGIALILSLSTGINSYIAQVQEETLSSYPITIEAESVDMSTMMTAMMGARRAEDEQASREPDRVYSSTVMYDMMDSMFRAETTTNNLRPFREFLENGGGGIKDIATVQYSYDLPLDVYVKDEEGTIVKSDLEALMQDAMSAMTGGGTLPANSPPAVMSSGMDVWEELLAGGGGELVAGTVKDQYELLYGKWPDEYNEVVLFVDENNEISDLMLVSLGLVPSRELDETMEALRDGGELEPAQRSWSYEELCGMEYKLILPAERYQPDPVSGGFTDLAATDTGMELLYNSEETGTPLKVVGIVRPGKDATSTMVKGAIGYTTALTAYAIEKTADTDIVRKQLADSTVDVLNGLPFATGDETEPSDEEKKEGVSGYLTELDAQEKAAAYLDVMSQPSDDYVSGVVEQQMSGLAREDIETMILQQYAGEMGVDESTISSYISEMSDEELFTQVGEAIAQSVREQYAQGVRSQLGAMSVDQLAKMLELSLDGTEDPAVLRMGVTPFELWQYVYLYDNYMPPAYSESTYEDSLELLGVVDEADPAAVSIYASTFAGKDAVAGLIQDYNDGVDSEDDEITYTDYVALLMSSITDIISGISYLLIAFVSISLIVSSIMIGIITYISVLERTKEIGILRAVGASKRDVSRVFNAETLIIGLGAGLIGILATLLLIIPINAVLLHFTGIEGLKAALPVQGAVVLVAVSMFLTIISGFIPSKMAAKKDPVVALRTE